MVKRFKKASDIRVGIVGFGPSFGMGQLHYDYMKKAGMTPVAACDKNPACLQAAKDKDANLEAYTSLDQMLKKSKINTCIVITPHNSHCELACKCLNAGKNVVVEKPMAVTTAECNTMIAAAKRNRVVLSVFHNRHWDGFAKQMVQIVKKERQIGDIIRVEAHLGDYGAPGSWWRASKSISGGTLYDMGAHCLEYVLQLIDSPIVEVMGVGHVGYWNSKCTWGKDTNEDEMNAVVRFKSGQWLLLNSSNIDMNPKGQDRGWIEVTGTKGVYIMKPGNWRLIKNDGDRRVVTSGKDMPDSWPDYYRNLAAHMTKGVPLTITAELGRKVIHVLDLAGRSFKAGRTLKAER